VAFRLKKNVTGMQRWIMWKISNLDHAGRDTIPLSWYEAMNIVILINETFRCTTFNEVINYVWMKPKQ
jgi:hypothetical protein